MRFENLERYLFFNKVLDEKYVYFIISINIFFKFEKYKLINI